MKCVYSLSRLLLDYGCGSPRAIRVQRILNGDRRLDRRVRIVSDQFDILENEIAKCPDGGVQPQARRRAGRSTNAGCCSRPLGNTPQHSTWAASRRGVHQLREAHLAQETGLR